MSDLEKFFDPKSVAVIGASADKNKVGYSIMANLLGGKKRDIYPVTLNEKEILGVPAFTSVLDIQKEIDFAIIAVRADIVPQILEECGKKGIKNAIVISSGFKEVGPSGKDLEDKIKKIAEDQNIALLGPNCLGIIDSKSDFNASFSPQKPLPGRIAVLSQSGALGTAMLDWSLDEGVGFSKFISLGNEASLSESDFLKYLKDDPDTDAILIYLEKVNEGSKLLDLLKSITPRKPVVILKAGVSSYGAAAIMSHTGSLAPESKVFEAAVKQSGALMVSSVRKFFNAAKLLSLGIGTLDPIQRLVILTNGGGPSVIAADESGLSKSLSLVEFSESTKDELRKVLPKMASVRNPVDIIGDALAERYDKALDIICSVPEVDGVLVMLTPQMMTSAEETAKVLTKYKEKKKIMPVFIGGLSIQSGKAALIKEGLVNFVFSKDVITVLDIFANSASKLRPDFDQKKSEFDREIKQMPFSQTVRILNDYGVGISGAFINRKEDLESSLRLLGDGSYAMKAISPAASHKTDAGTVRLNVSNSDEAGRVWEELWTNPNVIGQVEGIAVQRMLKGREVIVGMKRDATFGPTILFGLGGVLAEAIKDTVLRVAPVEKEEALKMMHEIKGIKILEGMRGEPSVNFDLLADIIVNLSRLALEHPEIKEIDLNPVICSESEAVVVDARIMI